jgi:molybdenum cofactor guanylyltransferase
VTTARSNGPAPIYGLVLAGGHSRRMKTDKAALRYDGRFQTERAFALLAPRCAKVFLSNRADQADAPGHAGFSQLHDTVHDLGPMGGILSAFDAHPDIAWLVLACDLPYLDGKTLDHLVEHRNPAKIATAYTSSHDGLPEPLCAIYEPHSRDALRALVARGVTCPRKAMIQSDVELLEPVNALALENINTPGDYEETQRKPPTTHGPGDSKGNI